MNRLYNAPPQNLSQDGPVASLYGRGIGWAIHQFPKPFRGIGYRSDFQNVTNKHVQFINMLLESIQPLFQRQFGRSWSPCLEVSNLGKKSKHRPTHDADLLSRLALAWIRASCDLNDALMELFVAVNIQGWAKFAEHLLACSSLRQKSSHNIQRLNCHCHSDDRFAFCVSFV